MRNLPRFSVIITAFNRKKHVIGAVKSMLNRLFQLEEVETIVVMNFH